MTDVQLALGDGPTGRTDSAETLTALEVDYTPPAVALLCLLEILPDLVCARRIVDVGAGSGVWGRCLQALRREGYLPRSVHLQAVELRPSERAGLQLIYDEVQTCGVMDWLTREPSADRWHEDWAVGNPPFTAFVDGEWPRALLRHFNHVALLGLTSWGQGSKGANCLAPANQYRLGGRPTFRSGGKADQRDYSFWHWHHATAGMQPASWPTQQLARLPVELRRWQPEAVPGTFELSPRLVAQVMALRESYHRPRGAR